MLTWINQDARLAHLNTETVMHEIRPKPKWVEYAQNKWVGAWLVLAVLSVDMLDLVGWLIGWIWLIG